MLPTPAARPRVISDFGGYAMADIVRRQPSPVRSVFGDVFGFDPFRFFTQPEFLGIEARRTDAGYELEIPVAGFRPEDISVTVEDRVLNIEGRNERRRFTRSLTLPDDVDEERIEAKVEHGLLTLTLPFTPKAQPRRIDIKVGAAVGSSSTTPAKPNGERAGTAP